MKLEKAIELLELECSYPFPPELKDLHDATKLGIEALKRQKLMREHSGMSFDYYLPGETQD